MTNPCGGGGCWGLEAEGLLWQPLDWPYPVSGSAGFAQVVCQARPGDLEKAPKRKENGVRGVHGGEMVRFHDFR
ncbi:hypothetical protein CCM_07536 [Cordyceps militaris CM01]|uniref:Uncharacterized protein n=1 Tax=Cordyceps militaris (strain CM01) TaxID=983644 RepID=G3JQ33_CORMM|nr:uncharacterized protein CCM_07536 [Cordyceps militaris CM01]EGX89284.1 hypothetical protein CCM_07536 [Cordyceps militaris CM01]